MACVGNGTVSVVLPVRAVTRACAIKVPPRMKFTTGRPNPKFAKLAARDREAAPAGSRSRSGSGVMPLTPGTGRVSVTVSVALPMRLKELRARRLLPDLGLDRARGEPRHDSA